MYNEGCEPRSCGVDRLLDPDVCFDFLLLLLEAVLRPSLSLLRRVRTGSFELSKGNGMIELGPKRGTRQSSDRSLVCEDVFRAHVIKRRRKQSRSMAEKILLKTLRRSFVSANSTSNVNKRITIPMHLGLRIIDGCRKQVSAGPTEAVQHIEALELADLGAADSTSCGVTSRESKRGSHSVTK